ncbi:16S rRNA (uracil(1498)-N(3))-methyltransferase [Brevundimonas sp.]|uniref:16S rRNA (uracil(1498)-N(3))-methyltransferase n=1 Tax=Brevundimonas sp. TaxID=1871086 RepID=UPI002731CD37|nr:16S rRNA (uracil(1498)-N(3))-methyltransferase [Brevundimonas sp.]MDP1911988.1 16S rRNA (uracil(1498)-N(3))-methyltransferase [Brevundimonas sp.]
MIRLHVPTPLAPEAAVLPTLDQSRYLTQVMRLKIGDSLLVFNGRDGEWRCVITEVLKKGAVLRAEEQVRPQAIGPDVQLLISVVKKSALEFAVEKATELGARRVGLVVTHRTQTQHVRMDRLDAIAIEAAEQTGRLDVPMVDEPVKLADLLDGWEAGRRLMFCDETGGAPVRGALSPPPSGEGDHPKDGGGGKPLTPADGSAPSIASRSPSPDGGGIPWTILIGPEGGFSPEERDRLRALPFTTAVSLGPRILRADTAAIAALTLWQAAVGDWER